MYAPTWKGTDFTRPDYDIQEYHNFIKFVEGRIDIDKYQVLVKPHQAVFKHIAKDGNKDNLIPANIDTNEILSVVDILISDY